MRHHFWGVAPARPRRVNIRVRRCVLKVIAKWSATRRSSRVEPAVRSDGNAKTLRKTLGHA